MTLKPFLLYSDDSGNIFEDKSLYAIGRSAWEAFDIPDDVWIELPNGGSLYHLPQRQPIGIDVSTGELRLCELGWAVAAFIPPTFTSLYLAAYETEPKAPTLPLFCYTAVGWHKNKYFVTAIKVEADIRQDCAGYITKDIQKGANQLLRLYPQNRLVKHLMATCCLTYDCPAARNFALSRWECPIPVSTACNANCVGCISYQPAAETFEANHERLKFKPSVEEIVEFTVPHLLTAPFPIVSFGQGCEGEPLLMHAIIAQSIQEIRKHTTKGCININTNGSNPKAIETLALAGLDSMRLSLNSVQEKYYTPYYRPNDYHFNNIKESLKIMRKYQKWTSINYFIFPGFTDDSAEVESLYKFIEETQINMIQWRNLNLDPDWYLTKIKFQETENQIGIKKLFQQLQLDFPNLKHGYFNPPLERIQGNFNHDFAHE